MSTRTRSASTHKLSHSKDSDSGGQTLVCAGALSLAAHKIVTA